VKWRAADIMRIVVYRHPRTQEGSVNCMCKVPNRLFHGESIFNVDALHKAQRQTGKIHAANVSLYNGVDVQPGSVSIEISLETESEHQTDENQVSHALLQPVLAQMFINHTLGIFHNLRAREASMQAFDVYTVLLQDVPDIFEEVECHGINGAHQHIFRETTTASLTRDSFLRHHQVLYRRRLRPAKPSLIPGARPHNGTYFLRCGDDFLCLVNHGNKRGKARVFTYSLIDDGLFFSETSGARLKDCNSKHIVHARGNKSVRCAGTLRICHSPDRGFVLVFDNDSGTYKPRRKALELMDAVLARNFPELETLGLDVTEVQPQETMTWSGPDETTDKSIYAGQWKWRPVRKNHR